MCVSVDTSIQNVAYTELNKILLTILLGESGNDIPIIPDPEKDFLQSLEKSVNGDHLEW